MKKLVLALLVCSGLAYAEGDCSAIAQKVVNKLAEKNRTSVTINYSADKAQWAQICESAIKAQNNMITVNLNQVSGEGKFKFSK